MQCVIQLGAVSRWFCNEISFWCVRCFEVINTVRKDQHKARVEPGEKAVSMVACFACHIVKMYYVYCIY